MHMPSPGDLEQVPPKARPLRSGYRSSPAEGDPYWAFYDEVATVQLAGWLPHTRSRVLDLSGGHPRLTRQMLAGGHRVVQVLKEPPGGPPPRGRGQLARVLGDPRDLDWFASESVDAVVAEDRVLSSCLATENTLEQVFRVLRPGGRLLMSVDSLLLGLARLAEQHRWAELADVPAADVVLVPDDDGTITRCFWPEELKAVLAGAGFEVEWVRPRTVLSAEAVGRAVASDVTSLPTLVHTEVSLATEREGESIGMHLVSSARRPA